MGLGIVDNGKPARDSHSMLRERGITVRSMIDCVIAAIAEENRCCGLARDSDLRLITESGAVDLPAWPAR